MAATRTSKRSRTTSGKGAGMAARSRAHSTKKPSAPRKTTATKRATTRDRRATGAPTLARDPNLALFQAVLSGDAKATSAALAAGADPHAVDESGALIARLAIDRHDRKTVAALLKGGLDVNRPLVHEGCRA